MTMVFAQQPTDCVNSIIVCGSSEINLDVNGIGFQELFGSNNCASQENNSLWLQVTLVSNGTLGFTLTPGSTAITEDYDFFIFGPNVNCNNLGQAIRCSTTNPQAAGQGNNLTGMNGTETDVSEGPGPNGNSFVRWLDVLAGETYFIVIDRPIGNSPFNLEWTGTAQFPEPPVNGSNNDITVLNLENCDVLLPYNDGFTSFNLELNTNLVIGTQTNTIVTYHETESDANININAITSPYINLSNPQEIFIRLTNTITGCFEITQFDLNVSLGPEFAEPSDFELCDNFDDNNATNGFTTFNLQLRNEEILNGLDPSEVIITYHESLFDAETDINAIPFLYTNINADMQTVFVRIESATNSNCYSITTLVLIVKPVPQAINFSILQCDEDGNIDGFTIFDLTESHDVITDNDPNLSTQFYTSFNDAQNSINEIDGNSFFNWLNPQTIYVQVIDDISDCFNIAELLLEVSTTQSNDTQLRVCDDDGTEDGFYNFNLNDAENDIVNGLPVGLPVSYFEIYEDALLMQNSISNMYTNILAYSQIVYARVGSLNECYGISEIELTINELPQLLDDETQYYCLNFYPEYITINAGISNDNPNNYTYSWSSGQDTFEIQVNETGNYTVTVTNSYDCTQERTITVEASNIATFDTIEVIDGSQNNTVTIVVSGEGIYVYAIHDNEGMHTPFQSSNVFYNINPGIYVVEVRDIKNDCGIVEDVISVIGFPQFFTPNNDGYNDTWVVKGISSQFQPNSKILIFDRFGKLLKQLDPIGEGWDGTFNGKPLPVSDYWFSVTLQDGRTFMDHFSLKR